MPVISVDTKKKELIGNFKNAWASWCQEAEAVNDHDFDQDALGKAVPYGIYDLNHNLGYVYVGQFGRYAPVCGGSDCALVARRKASLFPGRQKLLILADAGGSNGCRPRLETATARTIGRQFGLEVTVCHYPTGASKWNPIEHRLFGPISINWAGKPLRTFETMLACIRGTTTETGLQVKAFLVDKVYDKGIKVTKEVMQTLQIMWLSLSTLELHYHPAPNIILMCGVILLQALISKILPISFPQLRNSYCYKMTGMKRRMF